MPVAGEEAISALRRLAYTTVNSHEDQGVLVEYLAALWAEMTDADKELVQAIYANEELYTEHVPFPVGYYISEERYLQWNRDTFLEEEEGMNAGADADADANADADADADADANDDIYVDGVYGVQLGGQRERWD